MVFVLLLSAVFSCSVIDSNQFALLQVNGKDSYCEYIHELSSSEIDLSLVLLNMIHCSPYCKGLPVGDIYSQYPGYYRVRGFDNLG